MFISVRNPRVLNGLTRFIRLKKVTNQLRVVSQLASTYAFIVLVMTDFLEFLMTRQFAFPGGRFSLRISLRTIH